MLNKTRAIVLHHIKYGESSLIVTLYTEKYGRLACMVKGIRSKKTRFPVTLFQPLTLLETVIYYKQNREVHRIKEVSCPFHYDTVPFNITKSAIALFLAEILYITLREEESNPSLFAFLFHSFQLLDTKDEGTANFHLLFLLHYSKYLGIFPEDLEGIENGLLSADLQVFSGMPADAVSAITPLLSNSPGQLEIIKLTNNSRSILLERILRYYAQHLEGMSRLKSVQILKEIFN